LHEFVVIILDGMMPKLSGYELARQHRGAIKVEDSGIGSTFLVETPLKTSALRFNSGLTNSNRHYRSPFYDSCYCNKLCC